MRRRVLDTRPIQNTTDSRCEIHALTSQDDYLNLIWALKSFYYFSRRSYRLAIHDDGTLTAAAHDTLSHHFPASRLISRAQGDQRAREFLAGRPRSISLRDTNHLSLKVFDFAAYLDCDRLMLLDSDILFFALPDALLRRVDDAAYTKNSLNLDWGYGYSVDKEEAQKRLPDCVFQERINSGLGLIHRASLNLDWIEQFLEIPNILSHPHRIEQTLLALCSSRYGHEMLPHEYDVQLGPWDPTLPCRHFTGPIRHRMYSEGIRHLVKVGFLRDCGYRQDNV